jgi:signal transduction histidine kinase
MNELIADLLSLARVSQGDLQLGAVDLSKMAEQIVADLRHREPARTVQVAIAAGLQETCDVRLARLAMENLLSNAWKYTGRRADARIEFGRQPAGAGQAEFFITDNGVGFNMDHAHNLFQPFYRLHHDTEFEGTGIGLATVHRVMERHRGHVSGEAQEGQGATFRFSFGAPADR